ncbi:hypothetical protein [Deinococcus sp. RM]|uniref:hypothetical protein n=1 Tax=Deinococcus sp. RM TaxID=2316359 RepID=UPI001314342C|nr:hypothetical protein [Deinococcus sp. RM]
MRVIRGVAILLAVMSALAAPLPRLPTSAATPDALLPAGWTVQQRLRADFNGDGLTDTVLVAQNTDPRQIHPAQQYQEAWNSNPRLLVGAFARRDGRAQLAFRSAVITTRTSPNMEDPFDGIKAFGRGFRLTLREFYWMGSWTAGSVTFTVRWQDGCFRVIGYDRYIFHRATHDSETVSINFLTGRMQVILESGAEAARPVERWSPYPGSRRVCLQDIPSGLDFRRDLP